MSNFCWLRIFTFGAPLVLPLILSAQFQPISQEELKMTSDPEAPGAAAVYLDYEETDVFKERYENHYARMKVLTEKGKDAASISIEYPAGQYSIGSISGRTIHPDGTVVPLTVKPDDLVEVKTGDYRIQRKVFTLPSVEVGSVLEYFYQVRSTGWTPYVEWRVQRRYFIHKAHFQYTPLGVDFANQIWWPNLPKGAEVKKDVAGRFSLDIEDVPPIPDEEWMPPIDSFLYKVRFYYGSRYHSLDVEDYWKEGVKDWSKDVDHFAEPTKTIHDAVVGLIAPGDSDLEKAKKLYTAVQTLDNTDFSRVKSESERRQLHLKRAERAEDTWNQKSGNGNEIALLYLAMLRAAGLTAYGMQVVNRDRGVFNPSYMSLWQFDDYVVILNAGGKEIVLDPGEKMCPFGTVHWKHSGADGLRQGADGPGRAQTPPQAFGLNTVKRTGDLTIDEHGGVSGTIDYVMAGQEALRWRQAALEQDQTELKKNFDEQLGKLLPQGVGAHLDHFLALDQPDRNLMAVIKVSGTLGTGTARRLILPGFFFETRASEPFVNEEKRLEPVDMHYAGRVDDQLTYELPPGATVEGAPQDANIAWQGHAQYVSKTKAAPGQIVVARVLARAFTQVKAQDYQDLRGFYQKVAGADQASVVVKLAPTAKAE